MLRQNTIILTLTKLSFFFNLLHFNSYASFAFHTNYETVTELPREDDKTLARLPNTKGNNTVKPMNVINGKDETARRTEKHRMRIWKEGEKKVSQTWKEKRNDAGQRNSPGLVRQVWSWLGQTDTERERAGWNKKQGLGVVGWGVGGDVGRWTNVTSCRNLRHLGKEGPCRAPCRQARPRWREACRLAVCPSRWLESSSSRPCHLRRGGGRAASCWNTLVNQAALPT